MPLVSEQDVRRTAERGRRQLYAPVDAVITPAALEAADRIGVEIVHGSEPTVARATIDPARAVQRLLLRRSPRWVAPASRAGAAATRFSRVAFIGGGMVGTTAAHLTAMSGMADEVSIIDIVPGVGAAVALDIEHASGITRSATRARGGTALDLCSNADAIVVSAGRPRSPGMSRDGLMEVNRRVIRDIAEAIGNYAPNAVVVVITNPLDEMTYEMWRASSLPDRQIIGMAGTLDSSRFKNALADAAGVPPRDVWAVALGTHGAEMVPVISSATIKGRAVRDVLTKVAVDRCVSEAVNGGAAVVELRKSGSAFIAPAHATVEVLDAIRGATADPLPVSAMMHGEYGVRDIFLGVRARLGMCGVVEVVEERLDQAESQALQRAAASIAARLGLDGR